MPNYAAADRLADRVLDLLADDRDFQPLGERHVEALTALNQVIIAVLKTIPDPDARRHIAEQIERKIPVLLDAAGDSERRTLN
jgi:hypothetical protein